MSHCIKGMEHKFIFGKQDTREFLKSVFQKGYVLVKDYVDLPEEKKTITELIQFENLKARGRCAGQSATRQLFIVQRAEPVVWYEIHLNAGGTRFAVDPMQSRGVQLLLSPQDNQRIAVGRVSVCTDWINNDGSLSKATEEINIFGYAKKLIKHQSSGTVNGVSIGMNAHDLWQGGKVSLAPDLRNPESFNLKDYRSKQRRGI